MQNLATATTKTASRDFFDDDPDYSRKNKLEPCTNTREKCFFNYDNALGTRDPQVEFLQIAKQIKGKEKTFCIFGPDLSGNFGTLHGIGGLEATISLDRRGRSVTHEAAPIKDFLGNVLGYVDGKASQINWSPTATSAYGPTANTTVKVFGEDTDKWIEAIAWRGYSVDSTGFIHMGEREYDYQAGRFISTDPLGHAASADLYNYANCDPINFVDPWGRGPKETRNIASSMNPIGPMKYEPTSNSNWYGNQNDLFNTDFGTWKFIMGTQNAHKIYLSQNLPGSIRNKLSARYRVLQKAVSRQLELSNIQMDPQNITIRDAITMADNAASMAGGVPVLSHALTAYNLWSQFNETVYYGIHGNFYNRHWSCRCRQF